MRASGEGLACRQGGCDGAVGSYGSRVLGQPNNPNGVQYSLEDIREIAVCAEQEGTWLVLDEAFIDFIPPEDRQTLMPERRIIRGRSLSGQ